MKEKSRWYLGILLGSLVLPASSVYASSHLDNAVASFSVHVIASIVLYATSLTSLSFAAAEDWRLKARWQKSPRGLAPYKFFPKWIAVLATRVTGVMAGVYVLVLPLALPTEDPVGRVCLRIPCFFLACKLWDLTVARAHNPPIPRGARDDVVYGLTSWRPHVSYVWKLLTETRYASFDIAVDESRRETVPAMRGFWTCAPLLVLPLTYLLPIAELKVLSGLLGIQLGLEGLHTLLHPRCPNALFLHPWAARSFAEFWSVRWHQGAQPFLYSLAYSPASKVFGSYFGENAGRAAGVLAAFSLSGIWHAWCGAVLTRDEYAWNQAVGLWAVFMVQGGGFLIERSLMGSKKWRTGWRQKMVTVICWIVSVESAAIWLRYAEPRAKRLQGWTTF